MMTVTKSPKQALREHFDRLGFSRPTSGRPTASSWLPFGCGDVVREKDGRHEYRVEALDSFALSLTCLDNGWKRLDLTAADVELVRRAVR